MRAVPLLGNAEKAELESLIARAAWRSTTRPTAPERSWSRASRVVVNGVGIELDVGETLDPLAAVEVRTLFTALCYVTGGTMALPRDALAPLATEATSALAAQINRIVAGLKASMAQSRDGRAQPRGRVASLHADEAPRALPAGADRARRGRVALRLRRPALPRRA